MIEANAAKIDGVKISLLDKDRTRSRCDAACPRGVRMYTGDDFNYAELIAGDSARPFSHALLGIFDAIAPAAAAALGSLQTRATRLDVPRRSSHPPCRSAAISFATPTRFYKTGVVFMAYLNGHQDHFTMVGGQQSARSLPHLAELFRLADRAGLLRDPDDAAARMRRVLAVAGIA